MINQWLEIELYWRDTMGRKKKVIICGECYERPAEYRNVGFRQLCYCGECMLNLMVEAGILKRI